ncbi:succinate dehydrogenase, hydrophobic membrane anchor protein [uncultured Paracoccus sp.]|uniref:succinate dehydrogenase, hydrophobic membrane anchor protein n=1 Tax=uncultured Paracoccus sp. TaxID=189685 RepID=UPI00263A1E0F|nr:succinate dehydrogenase, hydrophobic membrane anchor protein [uncultured Paracoccus sp.]
MTTRTISPFARARGLGAAGHGTSYWWALRVSAVALVPLVLWLAVALAGGAAADHASLVVWLAAPLNSVLMILLLAAGFHHTALGLQVIAEDYIHSGARFAAVAVIQLACIAGAAAGIGAVLRITSSA